MSSNFVISLQKQFAMKKIYKLLLVIPIIITGCTVNDPLADITDEDSRLYISNYDKKVKFSDYKTYFVGDSAFSVLNNEARFSINRAKNSLFISYFRQNFENKNFKHVNKNENPDLGVTISRVTNSKIGAEAETKSYFNNYWNFPAYTTTGFSYPGYFDTYEVGDTIWNIEVVDLKNAVANDELRVVWNAQIQGNGVFEEENFAFTIEKIFEISTFLNENK
jgi:Domain of unknown function (DUF4136)